MLRPAYFGGRCEVIGNIFQDEYLYHFDFKGMYGQCMQQNFCFGSYKLKSLESDSTDFSTPGFYSIKFKSIGFHLPILPHHHLANQKLLFTNGVIRGIY